MDVNLLCLYYLAGNLSVQRPRGQVKAEATSPRGNRSRRHQAANLGGSNAINVKRLLFFASMKIMNKLNNNNYNVHNNNSIIFRCTTT
jgi:hypothetical protein